MKSAQSSAAKAARAVYTCVFDGYDELTAPAVRDPGTDYICFTDNPALPPNGWSIRTLDGAEMLAEDGTRRSRFAKICPHRVLADYDASLYVDANLRIVASVDPLFRHLDDAPVILFGHPEGRRSIYEEAEACVELGKDNPDRIARQLERYRALGFAGQSRDGAPTIPTGMAILRRHNEPAVAAAMDLWWDEYLAGSRRDQLSLPYALWSTGVPHAFLEGDSRHNAYFDWKRHTRSEGILSRRRRYQSAPAIVLHAPGSGEDWVSRAIRHATRPLETAEPGQENARILFDDNILGVAPDGAPPMELVLRDFLLQKPVALLRGNPKRGLARAQGLAEARGVGLADPSAFSASPIYGIARRQAFEDAVLDLMRRSSRPTVVLDEAALGIGRLGPLREWLRASGMAVSASRLQYEFLVCGLAKA